MKYQSIRSYSEADVERAIENDSTADLAQMVVSVSMSGEDIRWAESLCVRLARHNDRNVRGNAVLGFGHIARMHGKLVSSDAISLVTRALTDEDSYVRGQAISAADDIEQFLGVQIERQ